MAIVRSDSHLNVSAPPPSPRGVEPPSPIPTAAGSRSAANPVLSQFLDKSLHVPNLALPLPHFLVTTRHHQIPDEINLRSLVAGDAGSVDRLLKSAHEFGAFRINFHGISVEELLSLVRQAERVFGILEGRDTGSRRGSRGRNGNKEEIVWVRSRKERMDWAREYIGAELFQSFSEKMENVSSRLDAIAEQLGQVFLEHLGKQSARRTQERQSTLSMYKYNQDIINEQSSLSANVMNKLCDHVLSLHLPTKKCKYWMQSGPTPFSFNAGPDTIVVSVGKQLEEWSLGEFKCVIGEYIFQPTDPQTSFSIELKCSSLNIKQHFNRTLKTISIADQIQIALILVLLYSIFRFLWS